MDTSKLPAYECFKQVRAAEIVTFTHAQPGGVKPCICVKAPGEPNGVAFIDLTYEMIVRYTPKAGDFYIIYSDGYTSVSPRNIFFSGYHAIKGSTMQGYGTYKPEDGTVAQAGLQPIALSTLGAAIAEEMAQDWDFDAVAPAVVVGAPPGGLTKEEELALADPDNVAASLEEPDAYVPVTVLVGPFGRVLP